MIVGGALYGNLWPREVRRFVNRHVAQRQVAVLAERIGAKGHITFGGRLECNARGFPASAMAKASSGDWRNAWTRRWRG